jgi:hypothetical protein
MTDNSDRTQLVLKDKLELGLAYKDAFRGPPGQRVLRDLMHKFHILRSCFDADSLEMARMEGERNVVLHILNTLDWDTDKLKSFIDERGTNVSNETNSTKPGGK